MVRFDARRLKLPVTPLADLTDRSGGTTQLGVFLVRTDDPAKRLADLAGRAVMLGPEEEAETHQAAKAALQLARLAKPARLDAAGAVDSGVLALTDGEVAAAVVPEYLPPLLVGCEKVEAGSVRVLAKTKPVPGVRLFRTDVADDTLAKRVLAEITGLAERKETTAADQAGAADSRHVSPVYGLLYRTPLVCMDGRLSQSQSRACELSASARACGGRR